MTNVQAVGQHGILVDSPKGLEGLSLEQARHLGIRARFAVLSGKHYQLERAGQEAVSGCAQRAKGQRAAIGTPDSETVYRVLKLEEGGMFSGSSTMREILESHLGNFLGAHGKKFFYYPRLPVNITILRSMTV